MKKEHILPIAIIGLTIAFGVICFLVYITGGTPSLIKKKMRIGALLLSFNAIMWGTVHAQVEDYSCYLTPEIQFKQILFGLDAAYERTLSSNFPQHITEYSPNSPGTSLSGDGYHIGISFDYLFNHYDRNPKHSLICNIFYNHISGYNSTCISDESYFNQVLYGSSLNTKLNFQNEFSMDLIGINIFYNYKFYHNLSFGIGTQFEYRFSDKYVEKLSLSSFDIVHIRTDLPGVKTDSRAQEAILYDDKLKTIKSVQLGIPIEIRYDIIFNKFDIIPYVGFNYNITKWIGECRTDYFYAGFKLRLTKKDNFR